MRQIPGRRIANNTPVDPGFEGVGYSNKLVPATALKLPEVPAGKYPDAPQDHQRYHVWLPEKAGSLDLIITVTKRWLNRKPKAVLSRR